ncbi:tyrosine-protein phosphatase [Ruegeria sp. R14_0]|uniref:tyrosine-protein phosphatase n=1 Tax=Ruegeria sp. R14_0 TaxID=2821100 RepID=UPI001ADC2CDF|nr:tyrosine-protein phosphatase [Ruegeria sp. R14_0]MBO9446966.1 tyrosine-protein phosphatase [Ruegeria sp. R14_0]
MNLLRSIGTPLLLLMVGVCPGIAAEERAVPLEGVLNTRDLGGLKTEDGRTVRAKQLIRSGEIDEISNGGMQRLDDMGVSVIVDLRTTAEATAHPAQWPDGQGPARHNFPVMENESQMIDDMRASIKSGTAKAEETDALFAGAFGYIATDYTDEFRDLFDVLLGQPEGEAVLFHCSGGKDRTGVATALILTALGVSQKDIQADFMMSNILKDADQKAEQIAAEVNAVHGTSMTAEAVWPSLGVRESYLDEFYTSVEESYGSVDGYLRQGLGLTNEDLDTLRDRYLQ